MTWLPYWTVHFWFDMSKFFMCPGWHINGVNHGVKYFRNRQILLYKENGILSGFYYIKIKCIRKSLQKKPHIFPLHPIYTHTLYTAEKGICRERFLLFEDIVRLYKNTQGNLYSVYVFNIFWFSFSHIVVSSYFSYGVCNTYKN